MYVNIRLTIADTQLQCRETGVVFCQRKIAGMM